MEFNDFEKLATGLWEAKTVSEKESDDSWWRGFRECQAALLSSRCDAVLYSPDSHASCALKAGHKPVQALLRHITEDGEPFDRRDR